MIRKLEKTKERLLEIINNKRLKGMMNMKKEIRNIEINEDKVSKMIKKGKSLKLKIAAISPEIAKKVLFSLFKDEYKSKLIELEKSIKKNKKEIEEKTHWVMINKRVFMYYDEDLEEICRVHRILYDFLPTEGARLGYNKPNVLKEIEFVNSNYFKLRDLGEDLANEELTIEKALLLGLKDEKDYDLALELASYLDLLFMKKEEHKRKKEGMKTYVK